VDESVNIDARSFWKAVLVVAIGLTAYGVYCLIASPRVKDAAANLQRITCNQLIQNGAGNQRYVVLAEACLGSGPSVAERDWETNALEMYHPLYPANLNQEPKARDLGLILCIMDEMARRRIRDDSKERKKLGQPGLSDLTVAATRGVDKVPKWAQTGLREKYRGINLAKCWIVTVGEDEPTFAWARSLLWRGVLCLAAGGGMMLSWFVWRSSPLERGQDSSHPVTSPDIVTM
jgi:hypothetical protein